MAAAKTVFIIADSSCVLGIGRRSGKCPFCSRRYRSGIGARGCRGAGAGGIAGKSELPLHVMAVYSSVPGASKEIIEAGLSGMVSCDALQVEETTMPPSAALFRKDTESLSLRALGLSRLDALPAAEP